MKLIGNMKRWLIMGVTGDSIVMRNVNRRFHSLLIILFVCFYFFIYVLGSIAIFLVNLISKCLRGQSKQCLIFMVMYAIGFLGILVIVFLIILRYNGKFILKNGINEADDLITNIASVTPSADEVVLTNEKVLIFFKDIKETLSSGFNCEIRLIACGSIPERFAALQMIDWNIEIMNRDRVRALPSDQDVLIEPSKITASYLAQPDTIEIVQRESFIEEGFVMLNISKHIATRFNLEEGFLSTDTIKHSVKRCILENYEKDFLGIVYYHSSSGQPIHVQINGPAVNVCIRGLHSSVYLADFTFAIPCFEWPPESDWPSRDKKWPNQTAVTTIKSHGFHFVPKNQENDKLKLTWRYSFSLAERQLSKEVNEIARK